MTNPYLLIIKVNNYHRLSYPPCCLISLMRSLSFMGTSMMPWTGGLLPLENLTRVTSPGASANSAWTAAAESAMTALGKEKE